MKNLLVSICFFIINLTVEAQVFVNVLPYPNKVVMNENFYRIGNTLTVKTPSVLVQEIAYMKNIFASQLNIACINGKNGVIFTQDKKLKLEGYQLTVTPKDITIKFGGRAGAFYAIQTLYQLIQNAEQKEIPACTIYDEPAFSWRALMLDESRHFKGIQEVKKILDNMALLKMNILHWHLTDDQGWRIEIKKYPELTKVGGVRDHTQVGGYESTLYDHTPHSGFYKQDQIREIIAYAAERHITIVPEIEMPGHATAAIAAYPWLGTTGKSIAVTGKFGVHYEIFNIADPRVIGFLQDVLKEVAELFPGSVLHVGGDEVKFKNWQESKEIGALMKAKGISGYPDLQVDFTNQMSLFVEQTGKRMMGWNDIMGSKIHEWQDFSADKAAKSKLSKKTIVHFWKGDPLLIQKALEDGYDVVNSTHSNTYLDYDYKTISMEKAYKFNPIPEGIESDLSSRILGLGCQMWCEWLPTPSLMHRQIFPRLAAFAEVGWTKYENKNFERFQQLIPGLKKEWKRQGIDYYEE